MDNRRKWIIGSMVPFGLVTIVHVTAYAASFEPSLWTAWLGLPYAVAVEMAIIVAAYFTRWEKTQRIAWAGYFAFVIASGLMNVGYLAPEFTLSVAAVAAWTYALFPTVAIALLGFLYRQVDSLVAGKEAKAARASETASDKSETALRIERVQPAQLPEPAALPVVTCNVCGVTFGNRYQLSAHKRVHKVRVSQ